MRSLLPPIKQQSSPNGFTLVEVLIIAPIVVLAIGGFLALMMAMVGDVLVTRDHNAMSYESQAALDQIEQDTRISTQFLSTSRNLPSPQGSDGGTAPFLSTNALILGTLGTDKNPTDSTRQLIYYANQPNNCGPTQSQNKVFLNKIIYFIKNGSLWRRVTVPQYNTNVTVDSFTVCNAPWQRNSCSPGYTPGQCQSNDSEVMQNIDTFSVKYYSSPTSSTQLTGDDILNASTIDVTLNGKKTTLGKSVTTTATLRSTKLNSINADVPPPTTPIVSYSLSDPANADFSWPAVPTATNYKVSYQINGGSWTNTTLSGLTTSYTVAASRKNTVTIRVTAVNASGESPYGTATAVLPAWTDVTPVNGWINYSTPPYASPSYTKTTDGVVILKGLIKSGLATLEAPIFTLPPGYRPTYRLAFLVSTSNGASGTQGRIDVLPNGEVRFMSGSNTWIDLDTIHFLSATAPYTWNNLTTQNSWVNWGSPYSPLRATKDTSTRVHVEGIVKSGTATSGTTIAPLPANYAPALNLIVPAADSAFASFGVYSTNNVVARAMLTSFLSTQVMYYPSSYTTWSNLTLQNGWVNYAAGFATPQYTKSTDDIVTVKGLIKNGTITNGTLIATLPAGYRPGNRLIFASIGNTHYTRIDVDTNGTITIQGTGDAAFTSLDNINFIAEN